MLECDCLCARAYTQNTQMYLCLHVCRPMYVCMHVIIL